MLLKEILQKQEAVDDTVDLPLLLGHEMNYLITILHSYKKLAVEKISIMW